jgi:zinc protease
MTARVFRALAVAFVLTAAIAAQAPDRTRPPQLGPAPILQLPAIQKRALSNGVPVWLIESHEVPLAQVNVLVRSGSGDDPAGKYGIASFVAAMLDEGAGERSALELADAIEALGATLATGSSFDASAVRLNVPVGRLGDALPLLADVALRPTFPPAELERLRAERLTSLLQARDDPASIASRTFARVLYGPHRYGTGAIGTEQTLTGFAISDLKAFHAAHYTAANAALIVVGDVRMDAVLPLLERHFGMWAGLARQPTTHPQPVQPPTRRVVLVDKPGSAQSEIRIGWVGVPRSTPDYFPLEVMNTVLGGAFTSRLNQNLRERHGYTYGASSYFDMRRAAGPFVAAAAVQTDKTAEALREFFNELTGIRAPIPAPELARAKNNIVLSFPGEFETSTQLSRKLEDVLTYALPEDYFSKYTARVQAVTAAQVKQAGVKYVVPDRFLVVVVGDRKSVEAGVRALKLGSVDLMTVDQALGAAAAN